MDNYGRPVYKHAKGVIPGGAIPEGIAGALITLLTDMSNPDLTIMQRLGRAGIIGVQDAITASISNKVAKKATPYGVALGASLTGALVTPSTAGIATVPVAGAGGYIGGTIAFIGASYATTRFMDEIIWKSINNKVFPGLFP